MSDPNQPNELKVPILDQQTDSAQNKKARDFDPEIPYFLKQMDESAASPSSRLLLVALKAGAYLCAVPPILSLLKFIFRLGIANLFSFISCTIGFGALALILFSLEKILTAIMAAHEAEQ